MAVLNINTLTVPVTARNKRIYATTGTSTVTLAGSSGGSAGEPSLGNPAADGYILSSTTAGIRSWIAPTAAGVTSFNTRTGAVTLSKADVEAVLTGTISSHSHTNTGVLSFNTRTGAVTLLNTDVLPLTLTGYAVGTNTALAATDSILSAFGKVQAQINAKGAGTVTSVTAGNGLTQSGTASINPTIDVVSAAGTAGSVGTLTITADSVGVTLGTTSTTAAAGNHTHSNVDAATLGGKALTTLNGASGGGTWNAIPYIKSDGVFEIGKYLDFHDTASESADTQFRLTSSAGTLTATGAFIAAANSAGTTAQVPNAIYGTGTPPAASGVPYGTIYYKYV